MGKRWQALQQPLTIRPYVLLTQLPNCNRNGWLCLTAPITQQTSAADAATDTNIEPVLSPAPTEIGGDALLDWLREPEGVARWQSLWGDWSPADPQEEVAALAAEYAARQELLSLLSFITEETDQRIALALWYVRTRAAWSLINMRTGYEASAGYWNMPAIHGLSALSTLIGSIEPLLPETFRATAQDLWAQATVQAVTPTRPPPFGREEEGEATHDPDDFSVHGENDALRDRLQELRRIMTERDQERSLLAAEVGASSVADATEAARQKLRRLNTRLAEQAREIAHLRMERDEIAGHLPGREPATDAAEKIRALTQTVRNLESRLAIREADRRAFEKELGTSNAEDILAHVQALQSKEAKLKNRVSLLQTNGLFLLRELGGEETETGAAASDDGWFWQATEQARALKETAATRATEIAQLRGQWERVALEAGASEPDTIAERIRALQTELRRVQSEINELLNGDDGLGLGNAPTLPPLPASFFSRRP